MSRQDAIEATKSIEDAVQRLLAVANRELSQPLLIVPHISLDDESLGLEDPLLVELAKVVLVESPATLASSGWRGGPVLAAGIDCAGATEIFEQEARATAIFAVAPLADGTLPTKRA